MSVTLIRILIQNVDLKNELKIPRIYLYNTCFLIKKIFKHNSVVKNESSDV